MPTTVAVFTRDLRVQDNPMLTGAAHDADRVVPLFVLDDRIAKAGFATPGRTRFLAESLVDLDQTLRHRGGRLVVRAGEPIEQICRVAEQVNAARVHIAADASAYAQARQSALRSALQGQRRELCCHEDVHTVVAPGIVLPQGRDHFVVFTPYHRRWSEAVWRQPATTPEQIRLPDIEPGTLPVVPRSADNGFVGGETAGWRRVVTWMDQAVRDYERHHDALAEDGTSRLSPYLHFGCVSALELARSAGHCAGAQAFVRQLAWRDFHHQVLAARPDAAHRDYRSQGDRWRDDDAALHAWREGCTGIPIVDAGMRQLRAEGWMHNRARLITASFLTKSLYLDWRAGAAHFFQWLLDGDIANNCLNWQWVAGTGTDSRPNRVLNPLRQAQRYDPDGAYVRRYVPELAHLDSTDIHQPWRLPTGDKRSLDYPPPLLDLADARTRFLAARGR
ncbi:MAG: cryptochrome/photolyase family protein [Pseudonocardiales bacterium]